MTGSLRIFKEPRGFIRVIQAVMAIFAFSTTAGFSTTVSFIINCNNDTKTYPVNCTFGYPFSLRDKPVDYIASCDGAHKGNVTVPYVFSGSAEFFVATGVIAFLYTLVICVVYTVGQDTYQNNPMFPLVDMGVTCVITLFWLAGSSAWADSVSDVKYYMSPDNLKLFFCICREDDVICEDDKHGGYASLDVSLVFGFANFLLWVGSIWFVYKETTFHQKLEPQAQPNSTDKV